MQKALDELVALALVVKTARTYGKALYALNHEKIDDVRSLLRKTKN